MSDKLRGKEKNKEKDPSEGGLVNHNEVNPEEMDIDNNKESKEFFVDFSFLSQEVKAVIDDVVADYVGPGGGHGFDVTMNYTTEGNFEEGESAQRDLSTVAAILPILESLGGDLDKDFAQKLQGFIDTNVNNLQVLGQFAYLLNAMKDSLGDKKLQRVINDLMKKVNILSQEEKRKKEAQERTKEIESQKQLVDMLFSLTALPTTKEGLIQYADHLDALKKLLSDQNTFTALIEKFKGEIQNDTEKDKAQKDIALAQYDKLLARFTQMNNLVVEMEKVLYGMSVDDLLTKSKDMTIEQIAADTDCLRSMNTIFHMDPKKYEELCQKLQASDEGALKIMRAYVSKEDTSLDVKTITCKIGENRSVDLYQGEKRLNDGDGDPMTIFFGIADEKGGYRPATFADLLRDTGWKGKVLNEMIVTASVDEKGNKTEQEKKKSKSFSEALAAMRDSGIWREFQKILLSLDGMDGKVSESTEVKLAYLHALDGIETEWKDHKEQYATYLKNGEKVADFNIIVAVNDYKFASYQLTDEDNKPYQTTDPLKGEKNFFATLSAGEQIKYILSKDERKKIQSGKNSLTTDTKEGISLKDFENQYDPTVKTSVEDYNKESNPLLGIEIGSGQQIIIDMLKRDSNAPGQVELYADGDDASEPYLLVDGQAVGLSIDGSEKKAIGSYAILEEGEEVVTKRIIVTLATVSEPARIEVSDVTISADDEVAFKKLYNDMAPGTGIWNISELATNHPDNLNMREMFIARALQLADVTKTNSEMQKVMAGLHRAVFNIQNDQFTLDNLKNNIDRAKKDMLDIVAKLTDGTVPTKSDAESAVNTRYAAFKTD